MATRDSKIVSFEAVQAKHKEGQKSSLKRIMGDLQNIYSIHLTDSLRRLLAVVDDELFKRSDKAESVIQQSLYFSAMRQVRVEASTLQSNIHLHLARGYDEFWKKNPLNAGSEAVAVSGVSDELGFALVENEALEEEIAISAMIDKGNNFFQDELSGLNKRLAFLLERENIEANENPLAPYALCHAFSTAIKPLSSDLTVTLLIYKLFDQVVLSALGQLYHDLNMQLIKEGILPTLSRHIKRPSTPSAGRSAQGSKEEADHKLNDNQQAYLEVFYGMQQLLDGWRAQMGYPRTPAERERAGPVFNTGEILGALNVLQTPGMARGSQAQSVGSDVLKSYVTAQLARLQPGEERPLARTEEDIIDMVALIFDFILEDHNLPDPVKGLIARLQIPVVKVAIIEKSFFGRKNHPVRLLLNALAQAGIGLDTAEGVTHMPIFKKIESIVTRALDEFDQNVGLFSDLLDEFMAFIEREAQRSRLAEERTRQVTQSKEQLHLAKRKIAYEIAMRLEGKGTPAAVRSFLYNTWKDVLVLSYLRRDKQAGDWEAALEVMDKLIGSVQPHEDAAARKAIIQTIPWLLKTIRSGLESISLDPQSVAIILKDIESCHVARLSKPISGAPAHPAAAFEDRIDEDEGHGVEIRDPELALAIGEIQAHLPDLENLAVRDLSRAPEEIGAAGHGADSIVENEYIFRARQLEIGAWVEFDDGKKRVRGKLSWKSQITATYVFVNRKGTKILEIALNDLAGRMGANTARVIEGAGIPLMDRAFGALIGKLQAPAAKPA